MTFIFTVAFDLHFLSVKQHSFNIIFEAQLTCLYLHKRFIDICQFVETSTLYMDCLRSFQHLYRGKKCIELAYFISKRQSRSSHTIIPESSYLIYKLYTHNGLNVSSIGPATCYFFTSASAAPGNILRAVIHQNSPEDDYLPVCPCFIAGRGFDAGFCMKLFTSNLRRLNIGHKSPSVMILCLGPGSE